MSRCEELREALVELARCRTDDPALRQHIQGCPACAARLADERELTAALRALAAVDAAQEAPPALEDQLRVRFRQRARPARPAIRPLRMALLAAAAALLVAMAVLLRPPPRAPEPADRAAAGVAEFLPLVYGDPFAGADAIHLTRVRVSRRALASFGYVLDAEDGPPLEAELLVGQDGLARGIRFVNADGGIRR